MGEGSGVIQERNSQNTQTKTRPSATTRKYIVYSEFTRELRAQRFTPGIKPTKKTATAHIIGIRTFPARVSKNILAPHRHTNAAGTSHSARNK
jgi:hypothetical protein